MNMEALFSFLNIKQNESIVYVYVEEQPISKLTCLLYARLKTVRFMKLIQACTGNSAHNREDRLHIHWRKFY